MHGPQKPRNVLPLSTTAGSAATESYSVEDIGRGGVEVSTATSRATWRLGNQGELSAGSGDHSESDKHKEWN